MLITKGGINRIIKESRLQDFKEKGYSVVDKSEEPVTEDINGITPEKEKNPFLKLRTIELEDKAQELEIDISDCKNNAERAAKLYEAVKSQEG